MRDKKKRPPEPHLLDNPAYWFISLQQAIRDRNERDKAEARRELLRLGIRVTYCRRPRPAPLATAGAAR